MRLSKRHTRGYRRGRSQHRSAFSFCSASDRRVHFGLGPAAAADRVTIHWPSGHIDRYQSVAADRIYVVTEGRGIRPL